MADDNSTLNPNAKSETADFDLASDFGGVAAGSKKHEIAENPEGLNLERDFGGSAIKTQTSGIGELFRGAIKSALPAAGGTIAGNVGYGVGASLFGGSLSLTAAAEGAELGALVTAPSGPGALIGGLAGGLAGFFGGSYLTNKIQDFVAEKVPTDLKIATGFDAATARAGQEQHPNYGQVGGLLPFALTASPTAKWDLAKRAFGGALMGGLDGIQQYGEDKPFNWTQLAISTGFGVIFNGHTPIGEKLSDATVGLGTKAISAVGRILPSRTITVAEARANGAYATESEFSGQTQRNPEAQLADQLPALVETVATGHNEYQARIEVVARKLDPEAFDLKDKLIAQQNELRNKINEIGAPSDKSVAEAKERLDSAKAAVEQTEFYRNTPQHRSLRVAARNAEADYNEILERHEAAKSGGMQYTAEMTALQRQIITFDEQLRDLSPRIRFANEQAAAKYNGMAVEPQPVANRIIPTEDQKEEVRRNGATLFPEEKMQATRPAGEPAKLPLAALDVFGTATNTEQVGTAGAPALTTENKAETPTAPTATAKPAKVSQPIAIQFEYIKQDMMKRLAHIGIPANELEAHAEFFAHEFVARAESMNGVYGDAVDLYRRDYFDLQNKVTGAKAPKPSAPSWLTPTKNSIPADKVIEPVKINGKTVEELAAEPRASAEEIKTEQKAVSEQQEKLKTQIETKGVDSIKKFDPNETIKFSSPEEAKKGVNRLFDVESLITDANRMQYKSGGDEFGVTDELKNAKAWVPEQGQGILVWEEKNGDLIVVDGHQRTGLARWLIKNGVEKHIDIPGVLIREVDGVTVEDARVRGAMINIVRGSGSALDGATIMRMHPEYLEGATSKSAEKPRNLAVLSDEAFGYVKQGVGGITEDQGALVGQELKNDGVRQLQALHLITELKPKNAAETKYIIDRVKNANVAKAEGQAQIEMFGKIDLPNIKAESQISGDVNSILAQITRQTKTAAAGAENILGKIDVAGNIAKSEATSQISEYFDRTKFSAGSVVADALKENARDLTDKKITRDQAVQNVRKAVETDYERFKKEGSIYRDENGQPINETSETDEADENQASLFQRKKNAPPNARIILNSNVGGRDLMQIFKTRNASSLFHEGAHRFLNNLMKDALHPEAPEQVQADAKTVLDWLGVEDFSKADPASKEGAKWIEAQEKFARSYERYLRDETAPTPALARLFQTLNKWFQQIYQSAKDLGVPITEDIRAVFDRRLTQEPRRTLIMGEHEEMPTMADDHAEDAKNTPPSHAEFAANRIAAEATNFIKDVPPEVLAKLEEAYAKIGEANSDLEAARGQSRAAEPATEIGTGTARTENVGESGARPELAAASSSGGNGNEPIQTGAGQARPEGAGLSAGAGTGSGNTGNRIATHPLDSESKPDISTKPKSDRLDKAGNIIVAHIRTIGDLNEAIKEKLGFDQEAHKNDLLHKNADANNDYLMQRQGVIPDAEVQRMADLLGLPRARLNLDSWTVGHAANAVEMRLAVKLVEQSIFEAQAAILKAATEKTPEAVIAAENAIADSSRVQGYFSGIKAESGRALRAQRMRDNLKTAGDMISYLENAKGLSLDQRLEQFELSLQADTPEKMAEILRKDSALPYGDWFYDVWMSAILSDIGAHITYMASTILTSAAHVSLDLPMASIIGALRERAGREGRHVTLPEIGAALRGYGKSIPASLKSVADSLRTGATSVLPGEKNFEVQKTLNYDTLNTPEAEQVDPKATFADAAAAFHSLTKSIFGAFRVNQTVIDSGVLNKNGAATRLWDSNNSIPNLAVGTTRIPIGTAIGLPPRIIGALHAAPKTANYISRIEQFAYRQAVSEGYTGTDLLERAQYYSENPTPKMREDAKENAKALGVMSDSTEFVKKLQHLTDHKILGVKLLKFIIPFPRISGNMMYLALERTPLGLLNGDVRSNLFSKDNFVSDTAWAKMTVGTMAAVSAGVLTHMNLMTPTGPLDPKARDMNRLAGIAPNSVTIGPLQFDLHRLGPLGMLFGLGSDLYEIAHQVDNETAGQLAQQIMNCFSKAIVDESFLKGPADLFKAIEQSDRFGPAYFSNLASSFVPFSGLLSAANRSIDPYQRDTRTALDSMIAKIPGWSQTLYPKVDIFGEPIPKEERLFGPLTNIYISKMSEDPVVLTMKALGINPAPVERQIAKVELTEEQYNDYATIAGRLVKSHLDALIQDPRFQQADDLTKIQTIHQQLKTDRETARGVLKLKYPDIPAEMIERKKYGPAGATPRQ